MTDTSQTPHRHGRKDLSEERRKMLGVSVRSASPHMAMAGLERIAGAAAASDVSSRCAPVEKPLAQPIAPRQSAGLAKGDR